MSGTDAPAAVVAAHGRSGPQAHSAGSDSFPGHAPFEGVLPVRFEQNIGQTDDQVRFMSRGGNRSFFLTPTEAVFVASEAVPGRQPASSASAGKFDACAPKRSVVLRMSFVDSEPTPRIRGERAIPTKSNYFIGSDPERWIVSVPNFAEVVVEQIYPGIDVVYRDDDGQVAFDLVVSSEADLGRVQLSYQGADQVNIGPDGSVLFDTSLGELRCRPPAVYLVDHHGRIRLDGRYEKRMDGRVGLASAPRGHRREFLRSTDPAFLTFLNGSGEEQAFAIAVDRAGSAYVTGYTRSADFPTTDSPRVSIAGEWDAFVARLTPDGRSLVYSTYLGGSQLHPGHSGSTTDFGADIAIDDSGAAYVTGTTDSADFPTTEGAFQRTVSPEGGGIASFVAKLSPSGDSLVYSSYLGGSGNENGRAIAVDSAGAAVVTGFTHALANDFPVADPFQAMYGGGGTDSYVTKVSPDGSFLVFSTYLGGTGQDDVRDVAIDREGNALVVGSTWSRDFPTVDAFQETLHGSGDPDYVTDAFITTFSPSGQVVFSTFLGGSGSEYIYAVSVDELGNVFVTGSTTSVDFPTRNAYQSDRPGDDGYPDAFVAKFDTNRVGEGSLLYSTYFGKDCDDHGTGIAVSPSGEVLVAGNEGWCAGGVYSSFVAKFDTNQSGVASLVSYAPMSSPGQDFVTFGLDVDEAGSAYLVGRRYLYPFVARLGDGMSSVVPPIVSSISGFRRNGRYRIVVSGEFFQPGAAVYIGGDTAQWGNAREVGTNQILLIGRRLDRRFPLGVPVVVRVVNPDGGAFITTFVRF
jgi:hypothetical protein